MEKSPDYVVFYPIVKSSVGSGFCMKVRHNDRRVLENLKGLLIDACVELDLNLENHTGMYEEDKKDG